MNEEELILNNTKLIYKVMKDMNCYWNTEDELQELYDNGLIGLIKGAKQYDPSISKPSTFLYIAIKHEILHGFYKNDMNKRKIYNETMISLDKYVDDKDDTTYLELIEDETINIEEEVEKKLEIERLMYAVNHLRIEKDRIFFCEYYGLNGNSPLTMQQIGDKHGVSREMVRVRVERARKNIKIYLENSKKEAFIKEKEK